MTQDNRLWVLMSRCLSGEATPAETEELQVLLKHAPDKQYLFGVLSAYFTDPPPSADKQTGDSGLEQRFRRIIDVKYPDVSGKNDKKYLRHRFAIGKPLLYAATIAALLLVGWSLLRLIGGPAPSLSAARSLRTEEVLAKAGARTRLLLPDGSLVWLNSNSKLRYSTKFNTINREVELDGEGFFDVAKKSGLPFIVHASSLDIEALGTTFIVKSYPQDATVEATLLKGAIEVRREGNPGTARVILKPYEKLVFNKSQPAPDDAPDKPADPVRETNRPISAGIAVNSIRQDLPDSEKVETAWMYNRLVFDGDDFQDLATKMERWYDVRIVVRDTGLNHYHFGGVFANESVQEALKALQLTASFTYTIDGKKIELYEKK